MLGVFFIGMALWALAPDKFEEDEAPLTRFGVFGTTLIAFFLAEMWEKTQIATVALAAQYQALFSVVARTTLSMMIANVPAVLMGDRIAQRMPNDTPFGLAAYCYARDVGRIFGSAKPSNMAW